jgi:tetratricopeptide (TPR) repeat protein
MLATRPRNEPRSRIPRALLLLAACALAAAPAILPAAAAAQEEGDNPLISRGEQEYDELRFEEALQTLSAALIRAGNSEADQIRIYRLLAFTYLALDRQDEASGAYRRLLGLNPEFQAGADISPRMREFFDQVRQQWEVAGRPGTPAPDPVTIRHRSPPQAERETEVELSATIEGAAGRVQNLILRYRRGGSEEAVFQELDCVRHGEEWSVTIPAEAVAPPLVEYYFEARDAGGLPIAARGDVAAPLRIAVPEPGGNVVEEAWFWVLIGGAVALIGGGIALGVVLGEEGATPQPQGTLIVNVN